MWFPGANGGNPEAGGIQDLAGATLELWRQAGRKVDRSGKAGGVRDLTELLVKCFISIVAFASEFEAGKKKEANPGQRVVF